MFILYNINVQANLVQVLDTSDKTKDIVRLSVLADQIRRGKIRVTGVGKLTNSIPVGSTPIAMYGIYVNFNAARTALQKLQSKQLAYY